MTDEAMPVGMMGGFDSSDEEEGGLSGVKVKMNLGGSKEKSKKKKHKKRKKEKSAKKEKSKTSEKAKKRKSVNKEEGEWVDGRLV